MPKGRRTQREYQSALDSAIFGRYEAEVFTDVWNELIDLRTAAGEVHVGMLLAEVERLRAIEAAARAVAGFIFIRNDGLVIDGSNNYEARNAAVAALHAALADGE